MHARRRRLSVIVITEYGIACRLGHQGAEVGALLQRGHTPPTARSQEAVDARCGCTPIARHEGALGDQALGIDGNRGLFTGRAARVALPTRHRALAMSGVRANEAAVVIGSGTVDEGTQIAIREHLGARGHARRVGPTTIPRLMASGVSANVAKVDVASSNLASRSQLQPSERQTRGNAAADGNPFRGDR